MVDITTNTTQVNGFDIIADDETYRVFAGVTVSITGDNAFFGVSSASGARIDVNGAVETTDPAFSAIYLKGKGATVDVGNAGSVTSQNSAVWLTGNNGRVLNAGTIDAVTFGIRIEGTNAFIRNGDTITSDGTGIRIEATGAEIENNGTITAIVGVKGFGAGGDALSLSNFGTITGSQFSFNGSSAVDTVINRNKMVGDVILLAGNDSFDTVSGTVTGSIFGGTGNDTYKVNKANVALVESANEGTDKVISSVSYVLKANFETLILSGSASINGTGTDKSDSITGNAAANRLSGKNGNDDLTGGKGNDILTGGSGVDTFIFSNLIGKDVVTDFAPNGASHDIIDLRTVSAIVDFADLKANHMAQSGADVVITISSANKITIEDVSLGSLGASEFLF